MLHPIDLTTEECEVLLRAGEVGRVALTTPDGPHIVPVNYVVLDETIVLRTSPYSLLGTYGRDSMVAFEVDQGQHRCWSVIARGRARAVDDEATTARVRAVAAARAWVGGSRHSLLRIRWVELTGHRLGRRWNPSPAPRDLGP